MIDSEKNEGILSFIKKHKSTVVIIILIFVGAILMISPSSKNEASEDDIEARLEELCSSLSGVGSCRVMVTYNVVGKSYASEGRKVVESVTVVCKGADKVGVRAELTAMLSSLFGIGANRIHISKMR